jgi:hypothetical protein
LGTCLIFAVHLAEESATAGARVSLRIVRSLSFIGILAILLLLEYSFDYFKRKHERSLGPGSIPGHWVERSKPVKNNTEERGSYIIIEPLSVDKYRVQGVVFDKNGGYRGRFEGNGEILSDQRTLHYHFNGHEELEHENGSGDFRFVEKDEAKATAFFGSYSLEGSGAVRNGEGKRVTEPAKKLTDEDKGEVVKAYLATPHASNLVQGMTH